MSAEIILIYLYRKFLLILFIKKIVSIYVNIKYRYMYDVVLGKNEILNHFI